MSKYKTVKPLLTKRHKRLILVFSKRYVSKNVSLWRTAIFADETKISHYSNGAQQIWRKAHENKFSASSVKHPTSVMLWSAFTATESGLICFYNTGKRCNSDWSLKVFNSQVRMTAFENILELVDEFYGTTRRLVTGARKLKMSYKETTFKCWSGLHRAWTLT